MFEKKARYSFKKGLPKNIVGSPFFTLRYQENDLEHFRYAVVVSKKIDARAVGRNRLRRRFTAILEKENPKKPARDMVFFLKKEILRLDNSQIKTEIQKIFLKI